MITAGVRVKGQSEEEVKKLQAALSIVTFGRSPWSKLAPEQHPGFLL